MKKQFGGCDTCSVAGGLTDAFDEDGTLNGSGSLKSINILLELLSIC